MSSEVPQPGAIPLRLAYTCAAEPNQYLAKHQLYPLQITQPPTPGLGLCVVIPARNEPEIQKTLTSLWRCVRPGYPVEIIVAVNASEADPAEVRTANERTLWQARQWARVHNTPGFSVHAVHFPVLPRRHAGVGMARKVGMDEAVARLRAGGTHEGVIASLDADCSCAPSYLVSIERFFRGHPKAPGASIYFEHEVNADEKPSMVEGITRYELFLRYYLQAQRYAGFPHAFHTVGSCMAFRCHAYERQGGMNRRQAGEDFYFLHKLIALGGYGEITDTVVNPSARASDRTPFGTGAAMRAWSADERCLDLSYAPDSFRALRDFFDKVPELFDFSERQTAAFIDTLPGTLTRFLRDKSGLEHIGEIRANCASRDSFCRRFYRWFSALKLLQYVRGAHIDYPSVPLEDASRRMLEWRGVPARARDLKALLKDYRDLERGQGLHA